MASLYWIKLYHELLHDPKMGRLSDRLWRRCIELMLIAGENGDDGVLPPVADMAWMLRVSEAELTADLEALAEWQFVTVTDSGWIVTNFAKRQSPVSDAERMSRMRDRKHKATYYAPDTTEKQECYAPVTKRNGDTDTDTDTDTERGAKIATVAATPSRKRAPRTKPKEEIPPAVQVYHGQTRRYPAKEWWSKLDATIGHKTEDIKFWAEVIFNYRGTYTNGLNVKAMLEYFERREIPGQRPERKGRDNGHNQRRVVTVDEPPTYAETCATRERLGLEPITEAEYERLK